MIISVRPLTVSIIHQHSQLSTDTQYELTCESWGSHPQPLITWWLDGRELSVGRAEVSNGGQDHPPQIWAQLKPGRVLGVYSFNVFPWSLKTTSLSKLPIPWSLDIDEWQRSLIASVPVTVWQWLPQRLMTVTPEKTPSDNETIQLGQCQSQQWRKCTYPNTLPSWSSLFFEVKDSNQKMTVSAA